MSAEQPQTRPAASELRRHSSLDDRFDPAVCILDYNPVWPALAQAELRRIKEALGDVARRLEHVGSTAVPGLAAKPILDLQLSVDALEPRATYVEPLARLGYLFVPAPESPDYHFFAKPPERPRTRHLHVCAVGSKHEFRHLAVRNFLRVHRKDAARYEALKRRVAAGTHRTGSPISKARRRMSRRLSNEHLLGLMAVAELTTGRDKRCATGAPAPL